MSEFDEWKEKYKPIKNPFVGGIMFETFGEEIEFVKNQNPLCVWTDIDCDGYNYIQNGWLFVNRLGYYITEVPFEQGEEILIELSVPDNNYGNCDFCGNIVTNDEYYENEENSPGDTCCCIKCAETRKEETDPNKLYDLQAEIDKFEIFTTSDIEEFAEIFYTPKIPLEKLQPILDKAIFIWRDRPELEREDFRTALQKFIHFYGFVTQIITFSDTNLEKLYEFSKALNLKLPIMRY